MLLHPLIRTHIRIPSKEKVAHSNEIINVYSNLLTTIGFEFWITIDLFLIKCSNIVYSTILHNIGRDYWETVAAAEKIEKLGTASMTFKTFKVFKTFAQVFKTS